MHIKKTKTNMLASKSKQLENNREKIPKIKVSKTFYSFCAIYANNTSQSTNQQNTKLLQNGCNHKI